MDCEVGTFSRGAKVQKYINIKVGNRDWKRQNVNLRRRLCDNIQVKFKKYTNELSVSLLPRHSAFSGCGCRNGSSMDGSCEYIE